MYVNDVGSIKMSRVVVLSIRAVAVIRRGWGGGGNKGYFVGKFFYLNLTT